METQGVESGPDATPEDINGIQGSLTDGPNQDDQYALAKALDKAKRDPRAALLELDPERQATVDDKRTDTELKRLYAKWFIGILIAQLLAMNLIVMVVGLDWLKYNESVINLFMGGTLGEVFGVVFVITKYLFSKK